MVKKSGTDHILKILTLLKTREKNCAMGRLVSNLQTFGMEGIRRLIA